MYLPAVDYAAFRIETSQFHDSEPEEKTSPAVSPFCCHRPGSTAHIPRRISPPIPSLLYPRTNPEVYHPSVRFFRNQDRERNQVIVRSQSCQNFDKDQIFRIFRRL